MTQSWNEDILRSQYMASVYSFQSVRMPSHCIAQRSWKDTDSKSCCNHARNSFRHRDRMRNLFGTEGKGNQQREEGFSNGKRAHDGEDRKGSEQRHKHGEQPSQNLRNNVYLS